MEGTGGLETILSADGIEDADYAAVRPDALQAAAVTQGRSHLVEAPMTPSEATTVATAIAFRRPQYSRQGELWVVDDRGEVTVVRERIAAEVTVPGLGNRRITSFRLAPDGVRVALVVEDPDGTTGIAMGAIVRSGEKVSVEGLHTMSASETTVSQRAVIDVGWRSSESLLALVSDGETDTVVSLPVDGSTLSPIGPIPEARLVELAVAPGVTPWVRTSDGRLLRYLADFRWTTMDAAVTSISYPG